MGRELVGTLLAACATDEQDSHNYQVSNLPGLDLKLYGANPMSNFIRFLFLAMAIPCAVTVVNAQTGLVSFRKPDGLILSTGNLYFTSHDAAGATVWRTSQTSVPGQETVLYWEAGARFGDIVFAQVGGAFFGYFFVQNASGITIKRVSLTGGPATVLTTVTNVDIANSHRNLVTDGVNLYWQDDVAIRKMPIGGGAVTALDPVSPNTPTAGLELQGGRIIYASVAAIRFVPTTGAVTSPLVRTIHNAATRVTALHAVSNGVYWGEQNGAVRLKVGSTVTTLRASGPVPTSISNNQSSSGGAQSWTRCGNQTCELQFVFSFVQATKAIGADAFGVTVTPGTRTVFWGDAAGVHKQVF